MEGPEIIELPGFYHGHPIPEGAVFKGWLASGQVKKAVYDHFGATYFSKSYPLGDGQTAYDVNMMRACQRRLRVNPPRLP